MSSLLLAGCCLGYCLKAPGLPSDQKLMLLYSEVQGTSTCTSTCTGLGTSSGNKSIDKLIIAVMSSLLLAGCCLGYCLKAPGLPSDQKLMLL